MLKVNNRYNEKKMAVIIQGSEELQVNTYTNLTQNDSSVKSLINGGYVVVWASDGQDGSGYGIFGQVFDADGNKAGSEFQVNSFTANAQLHPVVTYLAGGGFMVSWSSNGQDGSASGVFGQVFDAAGSKVGGEFQINTQTNLSQYDSSVTTLSDGNVSVTWSSEGQDGSGFGIYGQILSPAGTKAGGEFKINTTTNSGQVFSSSASLLNGNFVVTWASFGQDGSDLGIFAQVFDSAGNKTGGEFQVNTHTNLAQTEPDITALDNGNFVVTWHSDGQDGSGLGVFGQIFDASGNKVGGEFQVNTQTNNEQSFSAVTALSGGNFVAVWQSKEQDGDGFGIYGQLFDSGGNKIDGEFRVNVESASVQAEVDVTTLNDGRFVVSWSSKGQDGSESGIFSRTFTVHDNVVEGTSEDDTIYGSSGGVVIDGLEGDDLLVGGAGDDLIYGGLGDDLIYGNEGNDIIHGSTDNADDIDVGRDILYGGAGDDIVYGYDGDDDIYGDIGNDKLYGGGGADLISGGGGNDNIFGGGGNDQLNGGTGADYIEGGAGDDLIIGGEQNDIILGATDNDIIEGGSGSDKIYGGLGDDHLFGNEGNDEITGGEGNDLILGDEGDDVLYGNAGDDIIAGGSGDDTAYGGDGNDILRGDEGNDYLNGMSGNDYIFGGAGDDEIEGHEGGDKIIGGVGSDYLTGGSGADIFSYRQVLDSNTLSFDIISDFVAGEDKLDFTLLSAEGINSIADIDITDDGVNTFIAGKNNNFYLQLSGVIAITDADILFASDDNQMLLGGIGDDSLTGGSDAIIDGGWGNDFIYSGASAGRLFGGYDDDIIIGGSLDDIIFGDAGDDILHGGDGDDDISGNDGNDHIYGGFGADILHGQGGDDIIYGGAGNDFLFGGSGNNELHGGDGDDYIQSGFGDDLIYGGAGDDSISASDGNDILYGGDGDDDLHGHTGDDRLYGGNGNDLLYGGSGNDYIEGGNGNDEVAGRSGNDILLGGDGDDIITGGDDAGRDILFGGNGNDFLYGGPGFDILTGGSGSDELWGGLGVDIFNYDNITDSTSAATDYVADFQKGFDKFDFAGLSIFGISDFSDITITNNGTDTFINGNGVDFEIQIGGVFNLTNSDFIW